MKPAGWTSHDVVAKMRRILGMKRIGHTGTLDPEVTGVLPLCLGQATRMVEYMQELPKEYVAELRIGYATDTEDTSGNVTESVPEVSLSDNDILEALQSFVGEIEQMPPMFSAVKHQGKRLYELARSGITVERKPRRAQIFGIWPIRIDTALSYPEAEFRVSCSKGTYIRTLCGDIGKKLGYPAVMSKLVRTKTGNLSLDQCVSIETVQMLQEQGEISSVMLPPDQAVSHFPAVHVPQDYAVKAWAGQSIPAAVSDDVIPDGTSLIRLYSADRKFIGIFEKSGEDRITAVKVFQQQKD